MASTGNKVIKPVRFTKDPDGTVKAWYRIEDLTLDPVNPRQHGERSLNAIAASYKAYKQQKPVVIDADGIVRAGNGSCEALLERGHKLIWAVRSKLQGHRAAGYGLTDNRAGDLAGWDYQQLADSLSRSVSMRGAVVGWTPEESAALIAAYAVIREAAETTATNTGALQAGLSIRLSGEEREAIDQAVALLSDDQAQFPSEGAAVEEICRQWLKRHRALAKKRKV
ncbi:MAG: hypothetical protein MOB07_31525 [Acidobacteria bacterium]|nr:hypothetical protein [Acidobacteriota bacterium]